MRPAQADQSQSLLHQRTVSQSENLEAVEQVRESQSLLHQRTVSQNRLSRRVHHLQHRLNRFFISEQFHSLDAILVLYAITDGLNRFFISEQFHRLASFRLLRRTTRSLNRFFISEQFHRDRSPELGAGGGHAGSQSLLHQRTVSQV